jgi:hypothetical protein
MTYYVKQQQQSLQLLASVDSKGRLQLVQGTHVGSVDGAR